MVQAVWHDTVIAESDDTVVVEGNHYFPVESLREEHFIPSDRRSTCPWKGLASYRSVSVDDKVNPDAAWEYKSPSVLARKVKGRVAFWRGVEVVSVEATDQRAAG